MGNSDPEFNLLFRWDWRAPLDDDCEEIEWESDDETARESRLQLFWVLQRKGIFQCTEVKVARSEEPQIRDWLKARMGHMLALWAPLLEDAAGAAVANG